jgi:hypothetical protein
LQNSIQGFSVYISRTVFDENGRNDGWPLDCLQEELDHICRVAPQFLKAMRTIKVFVEWDHVLPGRPDAVAVFYGGGGEGQLFAQGVNPSKAGHVTILSLKRISEAKRQGLAPRKAVFILHELAHAAHHYDLGDNNPFIENAYRQAMTRGLYSAVPDKLRGTVQAYAATNAHEYFAELTCAYLDYCDYFPHDREELREYDSVGYELMKKVWGNPPPIAPIDSKKAPAKSRRPPPLSPRPVAARPSASRQGLLWTFDNLCSYLEREGVKFRITDRYSGTVGGLLTQTEGKVVRTMLIRQYETEAEVLKLKPEKSEGMIKVWGRFRVTSTSEKFFREVTDMLD